MFGTVWCINDVSISILDCVHGSVLVVCEGERCEGERVCVWVRVRVAVIASLTEIDMFESICYLFAPHRVVSSLVS